MTVALATAVRSARLQVIVNALDVDADPAQLLLYAGTRPTTPGAATSEALQVTIDLPKPCGTVAAAVLTFVDGSEGLRVDDQDITWGRFVNGAGGFVMDADVSLPAGSGDIKISNASGFIGGIVRILSGFMTE